MYHHCLNITNSHFYTFINQYWGGSHTFLPLNTQYDDIFNNETKCNGGNNNYVNTGIDNYDINNNKSGTKQQQ